MAQLRGAVHGGVESARTTVLDSSVIDIALSLIVSDDSALVRERAASLLGEALRSGGGGEIPAAEGDALAVLARAAARDDSPLVRCAASTALADALTGDESAANALTFSPGGIAELAQALDGDIMNNNTGTGSGGGATRAAALLLVRGGAQAVTAALEDSLFFTALSNVLANQAHVLGLTLAYANLSKEEGGQYTIPIFPGKEKKEDDALDALAALRALVIPDAGKAAAVEVGIPASLCAHLIHPKQSVRCAAIGALAALSLHIPGALACLGDGRVLPAVLIPQLLYNQGIDGATVRGAIKTICLLPKGRAAFFSAAINEKSASGSWMRALCSILPAKDVARDLVAMAKSSPHISEKERNAIRIGITTLEETEIGLKALEDVPGSEEIRKRFS